MAGEMIQKDIEPGGEYYEVRCHLEEIAQELASESIEVKPFDRYHGPVCYISRKGVKASLWEDESGELIIRSEPGKEKKFIFYQDEAGPHIWDELAHS